MSTARVNKISPSGHHNLILLLALIFFISSLLTTTSGFLFRHSPADSFREDNENDSIFDPRQAAISSNSPSSSSSIFTSWMPKWLRTRVDYLHSIYRQFRSEDVTKLIREWMSLSTSEMTGINIRSSMTCYDDLGCFHAERNCFSLFFGVQNAVYSLEKINTTFLFFDRNGNNLHGDRTIIPYLNLTQDIKKVSLDGRKKTVIAVHGFNSGYEDSEWLPELKSLILNYTDENFIAVDWSGGANIINYQRARANTRVVGAQIARLIQLISKEFKVQPSNVTLIGHSLGAHTMGYAGSRYQEYESVKVGKILGLDPAGPCFGFNDTEYPSSERLDPSDAALVEVIHTNGIFGGEGIDVPLGHLDYYPNGGQVQPGCPAPLEVVLMPFRFKELSCSHVRAPDLMNAVRKNANSEFGSCQFVAYKCESRDDFLRGNCASCENGKCQLMFHRKLTDAGALSGTHLIDDPVVASGASGDHIPHDQNYLTGKTMIAKFNNSYFIETTDSYPFCMHHYKVRIELESNEVNNEITNNGTLEIKMASKGPSPRAGTVNITLDGNSNANTPLEALMFIPAENATNDDPGAFTRLGVQFHPVKEKNSQVPQAGQILSPTTTTEAPVQDINLKSIQYTYMSDIRKQIRNKLSGSISQHAPVHPSTDGASGFHFPALSSPHFPHFFPVEN